LVKLVRYAEYVHEMHVLVHALRVAIKGMLWSMLLLSGVIVTGGVLVVQLAYPYMDDVTIEETHRLWLYEMFGTTARAVWTMFECTFTGGWRMYARPLIEEIDAPIFGTFWLLYVLCVNFLVMKVVGSLFLKNTLQVAAADEEKINKHKSQQKQRYFSSQLRAIFASADSSGDGAISRQEFDDMVLEDKDVILHFNELDLEIDEVSALMTVLCADDGVADFEEFLEGALRMKCNARAIDTIQILHVALKVQKDMAALIQQMSLLNSTKGDKPDEQVQENAWKDDALRSQERMAQIRSLHLGENSGPNKVGSQKSQEAIRPVAVKQSIPMPKDLDEEYLRTELSPIPENGEQFTVQEIASGLSVTAQLLEEWNVDHERNGHETRPERNGAAPVALIGEWDMGVDQNGREIRPEHIYVEGI